MVVEQGFFFFNKRLAGRRRGSREVNAIVGETSEMSRKYKRAT